MGRYATSERPKETNCMGKITAVLILLIFTISSVAIIHPAQATFTLGDLTGTYRFHENDFDPHVPGVIGYVWPGGGEDSYAGAPNVASSFLSPGYQSPYPCRLSGEDPNSHNPSTESPSNQCNPAGAPTSSWYQLQGSAYAPFGAILTGSTGDLIFALNATAGFTGRWRGLGILLPPGFSVPDSPQIVTTITNDYSGIAVIRVGPYDRYAPGWTLVSILSDAGCDASAPLIPPTSTTPTAACSFPLPSGNTLNVPAQPPAGYYDHQAIDFTSAGEWYYVRINGVLAPSIAGRYFFKVLLYAGTNSIAGEEGVPLPQPVTGGLGTCSQSITSTSASNPFGGTLPPPTFSANLPIPFESCSEFIPTENWPVLLVKAEIDPAIITGTIRYGGYNSTLYGAPIGEAGMVLAKMQTRLDPYTGEQRPDLPTVNAQGYFNATAQGHYEIEGVAPGIYDIYAEAAGFPQQLCVTGVTILKGQSLHFDCYVQPGPVIHGNVFTKHQFGDEPWMGEAYPCTNGIPNNPAFCSTQTYNEYIKIELYDAPTLSNIPDPRAHLVSWSPLPCVAGGQDFYNGNSQNNAGNCADPRLGSQIGFPWHEYTTANGYNVKQVSLSGQWLNSAIECPTTANLNCIPLTQDPQGVGPPQHWFVLGGTTTPFHFEFGVKGEYGAPRDLDGQVPQLYATWVNGLTPGRYYARAWVFRYVQTALDGATFQEYYFDVTPQEWAGDVTLPIDLRLSSWVNKTVHFHDELDGITNEPINTGAGLMSGVLVGADGNVYSYNQTLLGYLGCYSIGKLSGWGSNAFFRGPAGSNCALTPTNSPGNFLAQTPTTINRIDLDKAELNAQAINTGRANIQFWGWNATWGGENYGIPSGTYTPHVYVLGYLENGPPEQVSVTLSGTVTSVSDHLYRGVGFNTTVYSIDWERPTVNRDWVWGNPVGYTLCGFLVNNIPGRPLVATRGFAGGTGSCAGLGNVNQQIPTPAVGSNPRCPGLATAGLGCMVGEEIDIGIYANNTLFDFVGDQPSNLQDTVLSSCLFQSQTNASVNMCGGGWDPLYDYPGGGPLPYEGNSNDTYFGQELSTPGAVGGFMGGIMYFEISQILFGPAHYTPSTLPNGATYMGAVTGYLNLYPSAIPAGEYSFRGFTYGYVQDEPFSIYALPTEVADIRLNLVIGVNVTLDILFKKEHVITPTAANMSARVRLFDDSGKLVAEWMSSEGTYVPPNNQPFSNPNGLATNGRAVAADGEDQFPFGPLHPAVPVPEPLNTYNFVPGGVTLLHVLMAGLPQVPAAGTDTGVSAIGVPQQQYMNDPLLAVTSCGFQVNCYVSPGEGLGVGVPGYFPNTGILGYPDYQGGWTAEVDFVNWYNNNTATPEAGNSFTLPVSGSSPFPQVATLCAGGALCTNTASPTPVAFAQYYAPVPGLLLGESYHIIPGTTATSGISLTEDFALTPALVGHSLVANHLGPYSQEGVWQISGAHLSGEASGIFEVDLNGFISGTALAFTWANDFRPLSWATVSVTGASGTTWNYYTFDGLYGMYLPGGSYSLTIASPGIASQTLSIAVTGGEVGTAGNVYMQQSNIPVPEFINIAIVAFSSLAASAYLLRRRRR
ncbi:MAG TPA: hypothetical protein VJZ32_06670 [Candidatus Bathyarchaeia archaeon]|nr:hypothetical protein [Candidatus Bathyarchaeia archaeon]